ncbi:MAG: aminotransferase class I/II-fold pyridoxal phosphate-dependent enzyme, partial [Bdellovibrionia bacterium]
HGVSVKVSPSLVEKFNLLENQILPGGKLCWETSEFTAGRLVVKFQKTLDSDTALLGLFLIDARFPLEGTLARYLEIDFDLDDSVGSYELGPDNVGLGDFLGKEWNDHDIFTKAKKFDVFHQAFSRSNRWGYYIPRKPSKGTRVNLATSRKNGRDDFVIMASNDYLGLASHPEVVNAATVALEKYGFGSTGSAVTVGQTEEHSNLEDKLARIFRTEGALLFNSGYAANVGTISALVGPRDLVLADFLSHASIYDGMQLSSGIKRFFKHNDLDHAKKVLDRTRGEAAGGLIVAEGIFSMDGDAANLRGLKALAKDYSCRIMVDEAHSFGVLGQHGLGLGEDAGLLGGIDITMGTFSKICGGIGGFICASQEVIGWLKLSARSAFFSVSLPPSNVAAASKALDIFLSQPNLLIKLRNNIQHFARGLREIGFPVPEDHKSAIVPVIIGDEAKMAKMYQVIFENGIYTIPVTFPAVARNNCRFRFTVTAAHTTSELDYALLVIRQAATEAGIDLQQIKKAA